MSYYFLTVEGGKQLFEFLPAVSTIEATLEQAKDIHASYPNANITLYSDIRSTLTAPKKIGTYWDRHKPNYPADKVFLTRCKEYSLFDEYIDAKNSVIAVLDSFILDLTPWYKVERISYDERRNRHYDHNGYVI